MRHLLPSILVRMLILIILAGAAYWAASSLMYSLNDYRSPLSGSPPMPGEPLSESDLLPVTRRVVVVLIDALRADTALNARAMPFLDELRQQSAIDFRFYTPGDDAAADRQVVDAALPWLRSGDLQLVLVHLDQVDHAGHYEGGPRDPRWDAAARRTDDLLREIAAKIDLAQDTLLVVSDHGQVDTGGHGGQEAIVLREPFVLAGAGVRPGYYGDVNMVDVAPTLAALLGASLPASSQGQVRSEMLLLPGDVLSSLPGVLEKQQGQLVKLYFDQIGSAAEVENREDVVVAHQKAMQSARLQRLARERLVRLPLALGAAILPFFWLLRRTRKEIAWLVGAGLFYLFFFNLRYIVFDSKTYSLSSVISQDDLILYTAMTAALSLLAAWLVYSLGQRLFRQAPARAVIAGLDMVLSVIYLLFLVYLVNYAWNGALVTWTLPDFLTHFLGFYSALQILFVATAGLLLAGISGVIAWLTQREIVKISIPHRSKVSRSSTPFLLTSSSRIGATKSAMFLGWGSND